MLTLRNLRTHILKVPSYKRQFCVTTPTPSSQQPKNPNNYRHNYFSDQQNFKPYEDDNTIITPTTNKDTNKDISTTITKSSTGGIFGSIKYQMTHLSKVTKSGLITFWNDRIYYKENLLPKAAVLNESFPTRIIPSFPIYNKYSFDYLTYHERKSIITYRYDRLTILPLSLFLMIPFSTLFLPFYIKFLPNLLPRGFSDRNQELHMHETLNSFKRRIVEKLIKNFNIQEEINSLNIQSINDISPLKIKPIQYKLDFNFDGETKRLLLKQYCRILGHTTMFNSNQQLITKVLNSGDYKLQENEAILKEINNLTFEDLQDLLLSRSLSCRDMNYNEMKNKFIKYSQLLKSISVIEDGNEKDLTLNPNITMNNRHTFNFYKQYLVLELILIRYKL